MKTVPALWFRPFAAGPLGLALLLPLVTACSTVQPAAVQGLSQQQKNQVAETVVQRLRARYADTRGACPGDTPAFDCNGVLIRGLSYWDAPDWWEVVQKDIDRQGVSFSYLRADVGTTTLWPNAGLIMRELDAHAGVALKVKWGRSMSRAISG